MYSAHTWGKSIAWYIQVHVGLWYHTIVWYIPVHTCMNSVPPVTIPDVISYIYDLDIMIIVI